MWYPVLNAKQKQQTMIDTFGGYNHTARPAEAEFYDMQNMSGDDFPLLSTRGKRGILPVTDEYVGHMAKDGKLLCLKESGAETLKLTVKESVEAAELEPRPQDTSIPEPDMTLNVVSSSDLTDKERIGLFNFSRNNRNGQVRDRNYKEARIKNVTHLQDDNWQLVLERKDLDIGVEATCEFDGEKAFLAKQARVGSGYLYVTIRVTSEEYEKLIFSECFGEFRVGLDGDFALAIRGTRKFEHWKGYSPLKCTIENENVDTTGSGTIELKFDLTDFDLGYPENAGRYDRIETDVINLGTVLIMDMEGIVIWFPTGKTTSRLKFSEEEYRSEIARAGDEDRARIEEWEANRVSAITLKETLTEDIAAQIQKNNIQIGEETVFVDRVVCGKSGNAILYINKPHGTISKESQIDTGLPYLSLCEIDPQTGVTASAPIGVASAEGERMMLSMGAKVVVFPEKIEVNTLTKNTDGAYTDFGTLELSSDLKGCTDADNKNNLALLMMLCDSQYNYIGSPTVDKKAPTSPSNGAYWLDNSKAEAQLKVYSQSTNMWTTVETYLKIYSPYLSSGFEAGDAVQILDGAKAWAHPSVNFADDGNSHIVFAAGEEVPPSSHGTMERGYIVVRGILTTNTGALAFQDTDGVVMTIRRTVPDMDYIVESNNRLWGCRYGKNADGETVNEIYACKQGDAKNWFAYEGTAMDSYAASLGTDGPFTGAAVYAGNPVFFKENYMHRVYGSYPANYQIFTQAVHGVQQGCSRSLAVVNERIFYKAQDGIYVYDGSLPYLISEVFGQKTFTRAIGADGGGKYYVSLENTDGTRDLMVYDLRRRMWYREDKLPVRYMLPLGHTLIAVTRDRQMIDLLGRNGEAEPDVEWYAESGNIGYAIAAKKFVGHMLLRMDLSQGAYMRVQIAYDNDAAYTDMFTSSEAGVGTICVPVRPRRCDHFRVRICGKGAAKLISITKTIKGGSEK